MNIDISVIVCHHKGFFIDKFVESCLKQENVSFEIIVVTSDIDLASRGMKGCIVINGPQYPASKRNMGARIAKGKYLAFFDDDVEIRPDCLKEFKDCLDTQLPCGMVYGKLLKMDEPTRFDEAGGFLTWTGFIWSRAEQNEIDRGQYDSTECILAGKSASCMIRADLFKKVGGFDEDFGILGEETDLSWRVWLSGNLVFFLPYAVGLHAFNTRFKPAKDYYTSERVHFRGCCNYVTLLLKNLEARNLWRILPIHLLAWFTAGCVMICTLKLKQGANVLKGLVYVLSNIGKIWKKSREVQSSRVISDRKLFSYIYKNPSIGYYIQRFLRYITIGLHG